MPIYLSSFNDISATELTTKDDRVSSYFRSSGGNSEEGRSYWITLQQPQFNTAQIDVKEWIINQELNINHDSKEVVNIIDSELGGKPAYQIQFYLDNSGTPGFEKVYFQTREGIRSIGFRAWDNEKQRQLDYKIYRQILSTLRFTNQYE